MDNLANAKVLNWDIANGSSISRVAKLRDRGSKCKPSNGRSRSYRETTAPFCRKMSGRKVTGRSISIQSSIMELHDPWISAPFCPS